MSWYSIIFPIQTRDVEVGVLDCKAMWTCRYIPIFQRNKLFPSSRLKVKTVCPQNSGTYLQVHNSITTHKKNINIFTALRATNITYERRDISY
jgi:hypothetical protein